MESRRDRPLTIGHISDLHISAECCDRSLSRSSRLLDHVLSRPIDHLVITGDITASGSEHELDLARSLFAQFGLLCSDRLTLVIGNHDIFGGVRSADDILTFPSRLRATDYEKKIADFRRAFRETFNDCLFGSRELAFPFIKRIGHAALIGLNTIDRYSRIRNPLGSNGRVGRKERTRTARMITSPSLNALTKIVLMHHHAGASRRDLNGTLHSVWRTIEDETLRLRTQGKLFRLFLETGVDIVLHGHFHEMNQYTRHGIRCINSGASVLGDDPGMLSAHLIRTGNGMTRVEQLHWRDESEASGPRLHRPIAMIDHAA